jgi:hypothetical protein
MPAEPFADHLGLEHHLPNKLADALSTGRNEKSVSGLAPRILFNTL